MKNAIEKLLNDLKSQGISRRKIEQDMGYAPHYLDVALSKGGNEKLLIRLQAYQKEVLGKEISPQDTLSKIVSNQQAIIVMSAEILAELKKGGLIP